MRTGCREDEKLLVLGPARLWRVGDFLDLSKGRKLILDDLCKA